MSREVIRYWPAPAMFFISIILFYAVSGAWWLSLITAAFPLFIAFGIHVYSEHWSGFRRFAKEHGYVCGTREELVHQNITVPRVIEGKALRAFIAGKKKNTSFVIYDARTLRGLTTVFAIKHYLPSFTLRSKGTFARALFEQEHHDRAGAFNELFKIDVEESVQVDELFDEEIQEELLSSDWKTVHMKSTRGWLYIHFGRAIPGHQLAEHFKNVQHLMDLFRDEEDVHEWRAHE